MTSSPADKRTPVERSDQHLISQLHIIIVSYQTRDLLRDCLRSIAPVCGHGKAEVTLVDNASGDGSVEMLREEFKWVRCIENETNTGFAAANNRALKNNMSEYVLLLNPDTIVSGGAIEASLKYIAGHAEVGLLGCRLLNPDGSFQPSARCFPTMWTLFLEMSLVYKIIPSSWSRFQPWILMPDTIQETDIVKGAFFLTRSRVWREVGLFDEDFFLYGEEHDWCRRIASAGWKAVYFPAVTVIHREGASSPIRRGSARFLLLESELRYHTKYHGILGGIGAMMLWLVGGILRTFLWAVAFAFSPSVRFRRSAKNRCIYYFHVCEWILARPYRGSQGLN